MFRSTAVDNEVSLSTEDRKFLQTMEKEIHKNRSVHWEMPLPFREGNVMLPNDRSQAAHRLSGLTRTLKRKPKMKKDYLEFMEAMISKGHATKVPMDELGKGGGHVWYLPHFRVYHPKKPSKIHVVGRNLCPIFIQVCCLRSPTAFSRYDSMGFYVLNLNFNVVTSKNLQFFL